MGQRFSVTSADGTTITAWRNGGAGPAVIIANGLGTPPEAWPELVDASCGLRVVTWYARGTAGGERPRDRSHIRIRDHADDLIAVLDHEGIGSAAVAAWSIGVNVAFEAANAHPDRITGILAVAGVPGGSFRAMGAPLAVPRPLRHGVGVGAAYAMRALAPVLQAAAGALPLTPATATAISHSGFVLPAARSEVLLPALREFRTHDWRWYFTLALAAADHRPMDLSFVTVPTTFVAGRFDVLTARSDMRRAARLVPHARLVTLPGSHFLPLEYPAEITALLRDLVAEASP